MKKSLLRLLFVLMTGMYCHASILVDDSFAGSSLSPDWAATLTPGASVSVANGKVTLDIRDVKNQYRAYLRMQKPEFNFFDEAVKVSASGLDLRGSASSAANAVWFFFGVADSPNINQLHPLDAHNGQFFAFKRILSGEKQITQLFALQRKNGVLTGNTTALANFSTAAIGSIEIIMDGNDWAITVKNPGGTILGNPVYSVTFENTPENYSAYHFVAGTFNNVTPSTGGSMDIGDIRIDSAKAIPVIVGSILPLRMRKTL